MWRAKRKWLNPIFIGKSGLEAFLFRASIALSLSKNNTLTSLDFDANVCVTTLCSQCTVGWWWTDGGLPLDAIGTGTFQFFILVQILNKRTFLQLRTF